MGECEGGGQKTTILCNDRKLVFLPFIPTGRFVEALDSDDEPWKDADMVFAHQEFRGAKMGAKISEEGDEWKEDWPSVISGHIHDRQILRNIYYTGSCLHNDFSDINTKKFVSLLDVSQGSLDMSHICLPRIITLHRIELTVEHGELAAILAGLIGKLRGHYGRW